jgi:hypothetical protein
MGANNLMGGTSPTWVQVMQQLLLVAPSLDHFVLPTPTQLGAAADTEFVCARYLNDLLNGLI